MTPDRRETLLVLEAQAGDRSALGALYEEVQAPLYRYLLGLLGRPDAAEDVLQEVFVRVHTKLRWLRDPELFRPWVYRIAAREAFKRLRRERRWVAGTEDASVLDRLPAAPVPADPELLASLPALLDGLSPSSRAVVLLHYAEELTIHEAADVLGIPVGTAKSRLAYGLDALRRRLRPGSGTGGIP